MSTRRKPNDPPPMVSTPKTRISFGNRAKDSPPASSPASGQTPRRDRGKSPATPATTPATPKSCRSAKNPSEPSPGIVTPPEPTSPSVSKKSTAKPRGKSFEKAALTPEAPKTPKRRGRPPNSALVVLDDSGPPELTPESRTNAPSTSRISSGKPGSAQKLAPTPTYSTRRGRINAAEAPKLTPEIPESSTSKGLARRGRPPLLREAPEAVSTSSSKGSHLKTRGKSAREAPAPASVASEFALAIVTSPVAVSSALKVTNASEAPRSAPEATLAPSKVPTTSNASRERKKSLEITESPSGSPQSTSAIGKSPAATSTAPTTKEAVKSTQNSSELAPAVSELPKTPRRRGRAPKQLPAAPEASDAPKSAPEGAPVAPEALETPNTSSGRKNVSKTPGESPESAAEISVMPTSPAATSSALTSTETVTTTQTAANLTPEVSPLPKLPERCGKAPKPTSSAPEASEEPHSAPEANPMAPEAQETPTTSENHKNASKMMELPSGRPESAPVITTSSDATSSTLTEVVTSTENASVVPRRRGRPPKPVPTASEAAERSDSVPDAPTTSTKRNTPGRRAASLRTTYSSARRIPQIRAMSSLRVMMLATEDMTVPEPSSLVKKRGRPANKDSAKIDSSSKRRRVHFADDDEEDEADNGPDSICSAADPNLEAEPLMDLDMDAAHITDSHVPESSTSSKSIPTSSSVVATVSESLPTAPAVKTTAPETPKTPQTPLDNATRPRGKSATPHPKAVKASVSLTSLIKAQKYPCTFSYCEQRPYTRERDLQLHLKNYHSHEMESADLETSGPAPKAPATQRGIAESVSDTELMVFDVPSSSSRSLGAQKRKRSVQPKTRESLSSPPPSPKRNCLSPSPSAPRSSSSLQVPNRVVIEESFETENEVVELTEVFRAPEADSKGVRIEKKNDEEVNHGQSAYSMFPFVYEPIEEPPEFVFSVGEMARKIILQLHQKIRFAPRAQNNGTYCIACLEYRPQSGTCHRRHDSNDDRIQKFWSSEFPHDPKTLSREVIMEDLEKICTEWE